MPLPESILLDELIKVAPGRGWALVEHTGSSATFLVLHPDQSTLGSRRISVRERAEGGLRVQGNDGGLDGPEKPFDLVGHEDLSRLVVFILAARANLE
jgi:hypothetical protein